MFKKTGITALSALFSVSLASAADFNLNRGDLNLKEQLSGIETPVPQQDKGIFDWLTGHNQKPEKPAALKEWTIMVFINGKNNLEQYALKDMNEMEKIGSTDKMNVVTQTGRIDGYDDGDGDWKTTRRYYIVKDNDENKLSSKMVQEMGKVDMGDWNSLAAFGTWAKKAYPAKKYMLIVWNHGSGWEKSLKARQNKGISYDDETDNHMTTPQLGQALKAIGKVDVYGSDACLMQMPEVDYELKDYTDYIVGSEETEPGDGYTYDLFLGPVAAKPEMTPAEVAKAAVDGYSDHYQSLSQASTQSFIKTAALGGLVQKVNAFVDAVMAAGLKKEVADARGAAQSYSIYDNKDLYHFVRLVSEKTQDAAVKARSAELMDFIKKDLVLHNRTNNKPYNPGGGGWDGGWDDPDYGDGYPPYAGAGLPPRAAATRGSNYDESHGIAVYLPGSSIGDGYNELAWSGASKWDEFINWYQAK